MPAAPSPAVHPPSRTKPSTRHRAGAIFRRLEAAYEEAPITLDYRDPVQLMVSVILSAQCTDERVNQLTPALFRRYPDAKSFAEADRLDLEEAIRPCGYYRAKAKHIQEACRALLERHCGRLPGTFEELTALPGIGRKSANVLLNEAFAVPAIAVDTHVKRVSYRLGLSTTLNPEKTERELEQVVPRRWWRKTTMLLIYHGRRVCKARKPLCPSCGVSGLCRWYQEAQEGRARAGERPG